jgi:hypothetical protein
MRMHRKVPERWMGREVPVDVMFGLVMDLSTRLKCGATG